MRPKRLPDPVVWGQLSALSMGAFVTIVCVIQCMDPWLIVNRVFFASIVTGATCAASIHLLNRVQYPHR